MIHVLMLAHDLRHPNLFFNADRAEERWLGVQGMLAAVPNGFASLAAFLASHGIPGDYAVHALVIALLGKMGLIAFQVALGLFSGYAVYRIAIRIGYSSKVSGLACGLYLLLPHALVFPHQLISEAVHTPLTIIALWLGIEALVGPPREAAGRALIAGALLGLAILIRPISLLWPGVLLIAFFMTRRWRPGLIHLAASTAPVAIWVTFIALQSGSPGLGASSHDAAHNLYQRTLRIAETLPQSEAAHLRSSYLQQGEIGTLSVASYLRMSFEYPVPVLKHAARDAVVFLTKSGVERLLFDYLELNQVSRKELQEESTGWRKRLDTEGAVAALGYLWETQGLLLFASLLGALAMVSLDLLAIVGGLNLLRRTQPPATRRIGILLVALIVYTLLFSLTVNAMQSRHRASTDFAFLLLAVHGLQSLRSKPARMHRPATCEVGA